MNLDIEPLLLRISLLNCNHHHHRGVLCKASNVGVILAFELTDTIKTFELTSPNFPVAMSGVTTAHCTIGFQV